uniref:DUF985 domain-containing protein n=1 Tax=Aegilops tauschii TaxID=37682 RepID=M8BYA1_AEGTA
MGSCEMTATEVAALLDLKPHPEGGFYAETFRDSSVSLTTAQLPPQYKGVFHICIAFLVLKPGISTRESLSRHLVNSRKRDPEKHYSLVGCTCAPGFEYEDFEMATFDDVKSIAPKAEPFLNYLIPSKK